MVAEVGTASASTAVSDGTTESLTGIASVASLPQALGVGALAVWGLSALWDWSPFRRALTWGLVTDSN